MDAYKKWFASVDKSAFTDEQKKNFQELHSKWKEVADNNSEECPV